MSGHPRYNVKQIPWLIDKKSVEIQYLFNSRLKRTILNNKDLNSALKKPCRHCQHADSNSVRTTTYSPISTRHRNPPMQPSLFKGPQRAARNHSVLILIENSNTSLMSYSRRCSPPSRNKRSNSFISSTPPISGTSSIHTRTPPKRSTATSSHSLTRRTRANSARRRTLSICKATASILSACESPALRARARSVAFAPAIPAKPRPHETTRWLKNSGRV